MGWVGCVVHSSKQARRCGKKLFGALSSRIDLPLCQSVVWFTAFIRGFWIPPCRACVRQASARGATANAGSFENSKSAATLVCRCVPSRRGRETSYRLKPTCSIGAPYQSYRHHTTFVHAPTSRLAVSQLLAPFVREDDLLSALLPSGSIDFSTLSPCIASGGGGRIYRCQVLASTSRQRNVFTNTRVTIAMHDAGSQP